MTLDLSSALTSADAAKLTGKTVRTIQRWVREGRIPAYRDPAGNLRFDPADLAPDRLLTPVVGAGA